MAKMNYNRPVHQQSDFNKYQQKQLEKKPLGDKPVIYNDTMRFGKHKGKRLSEVPKQYLEWLVSVTDDDLTALIYCRELARRLEPTKIEKPKESFINDESHDLGVFRLRKILGS